MKMQSLLLDSLTACWNKYKAELKTCRQQFSEEAVHDFRVAARRLLSVLDLLRAVIHDPEIQKTRRIVKAQLDDLDDLRDMQALLADMSEMIHETPVLQPFQEYLRHKEKHLMRLAHKDVKSLKIKSLSKRIHKLNRTIADFKHVDLNASIFSAVDEAYAIVTQRYALINPSQPSTIHRLRIAFKKFRYMVEVIYPILENVSVDYLKNMHDYQSAMGDIQDMEVALQELANFGKLAPASHDPKPACSYYIERHNLAISRFIEDKGGIIAFWRTAPDQPFPLETTI